MSNVIEEKSTKSEKKEQLKDLALKLGVIQREAKNLGIPAIVIIEGLDASDKGRLINAMVLEMDSRAYKIYSTHASEQEALEFPLLRRFWNHTPTKRQLQFFDRSAYYLVLDAWADGRIREDQLKRYWRDIKRFERQLHDDGTIIVKLFLTIPKKEQAKRFEALEANPKTAWRVTEKDWRRHWQYRSYLDQVESMVEKTNQDFAEWQLIDASDFRTAAIELYEAVIDKLDKAVVEKRRQTYQKKDSRKWIPYKGKRYLSKVKHPLAMDRAEYKKILKERQAEMHEIVHDIYYRKIPVIMAYCGWDAAGKGGCIKRLLQGIDPRSFQVIPVGAPNKTELSHHYLWRFWKEMPRRGKISIFDRSWYGRVLVERVEALCSNEEWQRAYKEINEMEEHLVDYGAVVIKFWLQIDKQTQLERFEARKENPYKSWKITDEDWRNREKWDLYEEAVDEMIDNTNTEKAPWSLISANCKMNARIQTLDITIDRLNKALKKRRLAVL